MRNAGIALTVCILLPTPAFAALMGPGDIAFIGFNADGNDDFSFVTLVDIDPSTSVFFADRTWNGTAFGASGTNEGTVTWFSGASTIAAGTVVSFNNVTSTERTVSHGIYADFVGVLNLQASDEALWAYLGPNRDTPTSFLAMIATESIGISAIPTINGTGLVSGTSAVIFQNDEDIMAYDGPRTGQASFSNYLSLIGNTSNWSTQNTNLLDDSNDGNAPDVPFDNTSFTLSATPAPEPSGLVLMVAAWGSLAGAAHLRRRKQAIPADSHIGS